MLKVVLIDSRKNIVTNLYSSDLYIKDIAVVANTDIPWYLLQDKSILITGATGLIGSFLIDVIMHKNIRDHLNCTILAVGRDRRKAEKRFDIFFKRIILSLLNVILIIL